MLKYKLLHNPRCRKSREGLKFLKAKKIEFETVLYLEDLLDKKQIEEIIDKSKLNPIDFIRKQEKVWKELFINKFLSKNQIIYVIFEHPKLMQRPIFISENKAIIANPPEESLKIL